MTHAEAVSPAFDVAAVRRDFPILDRVVAGGRPLVYLDNAATAQKPRAVIGAVAGYYQRHNANVHRGLHTLSEEATTAYEGAREKTRAFINAASEREIVFTRGTTESVNLVAQSYGRDRLKPGDEVLITHMEHHSNIVPWQLVCQQTGATLKAATIDERGELDLDAFDRLLSERTKIVAFVHISNALGTVNPAAELTAKAHAAGAVVMIDGAQATPHMPVDVQAIGCDFYAFSGHKMFGPTGIGALYGREALLDAMPPWQGGGDMIKTVSFENTVYNDLPYKFEAGTPNIAGVIGLGATVDYLNNLDFKAVQAYERDLLAYGEHLLAQVPGLELIGTARSKASVLGFTMAEAHPHDVGSILSHQGLAVRAGHHCAQPVMASFGVPATVRASLAFYNTREDLDALAKGLHKVNEVFGL